MIKIQVVNSSRALEWYSLAWNTFKTEPWLILLQALVFWLVQLLTQLFGPLSVLMSNVLWCLSAAGLYYVCLQIEKKQSIEFKDFFKAFEKNTRQLVVLGFYLAGLTVAYIMFVVVLAILLVGMNFLMVFSNIQKMAELVLANGIISIFVLTLIFLIPSMCLLMAGLFSPALVFFADVPPVKAMKMSLNACVHNSMPFLMHGVWFVLFGCVALLPLGLGLVVLMPIVNLTFYYAYRDILLVIAEPSVVNDSSY